MPKIADILNNRHKQSDFFLDSFCRHRGKPKPNKRRRKTSCRRVEVDEDQEFYNVTAKQASEFFGVSYDTIRTWILDGRLRGTRRPLRTSVKACKELQSQLLVEPPPPVPAAKLRTYHNKKRKPWQFIDPDQSGSE